MLQAYQPISQALCTTCGSWKSSDIHLTRFQALPMKVSWCLCIKYCICSDNLSATGTHIFTLDVIEWAVRLMQQPGVAQEMHYDYDCTGAIRHPCNAEGWRRFQE